MKRKTAYLRYVGSLLLFGFNGIVASFIELDSAQIVFTRTLIGSVFLAILFILSRQKAEVMKHKLRALYLVLSGMAMGVSWIFLYEAYRQIGVGFATLAYYCGPVLVVIFTPILFGERITRAQLAGFAAVLVGLFLVNGGVLRGEMSVRGLICGILSAVMYAAMVIFSKKAGSIRGLEKSLWQLIAGFLAVAVFLGFKGEFPLYMKPDSILPMLLLGVANTGLGCYLYFSSMSELPLQTVSVCGYLEPLSAVVFSAIILGERINAVQGLGAALILGGTAFGELSPWIRRKALSRKAYKKVRMR